ncbi:putative membrane protein [Bisgaardia hudsonensis]|uniref:Putative membrane protein n=1 Tax=Bisgaardia hudsonensis TaxID=109472 RepID=A0A4V2SIU2_9PAST|nr:DMT family transporter [Bisgaardia hudsonensis]QLB13531.1 transporter [Bisgaardia hudsonensis]TCP11154.1 putative membrane protein [Bisgaardia hudsonensis]
MQQKPILGFFYALTAAVMWGSLPIAIQQVLPAMNVETIVWYRFSAATLGLFLLLICSKKLPKLNNIHRRYWWFLLLGVIGLAANFFLFNYALKFIPPTTSQILSPFSSFMMLLFGVLLFKEKLGIHQKIGFILLVIGLLLFFNDRFSDFLQFNLYFKGVFLGFCASLIWVAYGIAQKMLLIKFSSQQVLFMIYIGCFAVFTPTAAPTQVMNLNLFQGLCLLYCCANTLIAYGAYAESLNCWDVAKVSAITTQIPIFTLVISHILVWVAPQYFTIDDLNWISYAGAIIVVSGALLSAIGHKFIKNKN